MLRVYLLHGGVWSFDGVVTSAGMNVLAGMLRKIIGVTVETYLWANWTTAYHDVMLWQKGHKVVVIGYSGGGMKATWIANGCVIGNDRRIHYLKPPRIDLLVGYDPSPKGSVQSIPESTQRAICYHNLSPWMLGLGGGMFVGGKQVENIPINEQHLMVQWDTKLHKRTCDEVRKLV